ncbi:MHS family MFS transporter [Amycolatopsis sp. K13G38]|uniref:MHS family MFS transporter n=1 Tax=Amycolatopsis acididurans TaxID=2724524 RepID=A0ABX1JAG3_9PSEU|nr:MFS transporter [Amycolatopsis acididurans]NKQ55535.1 MHS family MFS transporter [Amycolatopsis acididurans]
MSIQGRISPAAATTAAPHRRRVLMASVAAQSIEFYDFLIYGTAASLILNSHFFPSVNPVAGVLASFATFAVGFAGRPAGAAIFGHFGDKIGRKPALLAALILMAVSSTLIGLLPTFSTIGVAAPILLVLLRICQGIAVGGQWGGSTLLSLEHAPAGRRGLFGAIPQMGVFVGMISGTLVFLLMTNVTTAQQFSSWGWRVPFLLTVVMFPVAYYIHRYIEETPEFRQVEAAAAEQGGKKRSSVVTVLRHPKQMLLVAFTYVSATISFYVIVTGMLDYATRDLHIGKGTMLTAVMLSMIAWALSTLLFAWLSDIIGRRAIFAGGVVLSGAWVFALFPLVETRSFPLILLGASVGQIGVGAMFGPGITMFNEMFPSGTRYSGASMGYQFANVIGGGLAPFIMVALLEGTHTTAAVSVYVAAASLVSVIAVSLIRIPKPDTASAAAEVSG